MAPKEKQQIEIEKTHSDPLLSFNQAVTVDCSDFLGTALNRNIMANHATRSSTWAFSGQPCPGNDGCRSRLRDRWGIAGRPGRAEDVGGEILVSPHRAGCRSCFEGQMPRGARNFEKIHPRSRR